MSIDRGITRRRFVQTLAAGAACSIVPGNVTALERHRPPKRPPNVLFILADDLGYGDLSLYGRPDYRTPVLDRFAREGIRFTDAYTAQCICTPTRVAWITGRYPQRLPIGLVEPLAYGDNSVGIPPGHPTVASLLKSAGYDTSLVGKWHLGYLPEYSPITHGFDEFYGILSGGVDYFTHEEPSGKLDLHEGNVTVEQAGYMTDLLTDRAVKYLKRKHTRPFFLSLQYTAPHWPWEGPQDKHGAEKPHPIRFTGGGSPKIYASMMKSLDDNVGRVLKTLADAGLERDTLVVFTSDNGGERWSYNWPTSDGKATLREGGIRVPAAVRWPGVIPPNVVSHTPIITMDWTATLVKAGGASPDANYPFDGIDLMPLCRGAVTDRAMAERTFCFRTIRQSALRRGRWKYWEASLPKPGDTGLFDVVADPGEHANVRDQHGDVYDGLKQAFDAWNATMLPRPLPSSETGLP